MFVFKANLLLIRLLFLTTKALIKNDCFHRKQKERFVEFETFGNSFRKVGNFQSGVSLRQIGNFHFHFFSPETNITKLWASVNIYWTSWSTCRSQTALKTAETCFLQNFGSIYVFFIFISQKNLLKKPGWRWMCLCCTNMVWGFKKWTCNRATNCFIFVFREMIFENACF